MDSIQPIDYLLRSALAERSIKSTYLVISINFFHRSAKAERKRETVVLEKEDDCICSDCILPGQSIPEPPPD